MADTTVQPGTGEVSTLRARLLTALNTQAGLRQAIFMAETLAPRWPSGDLCRIPTRELRSLRQLGGSLGEKASLP